METSTGLSRLSDREGFLVAYPSAYGSRARWNIAGTSGAPDDVAFIRQLLDDLARRACVDPRRVFATGVSNGGGMVARLGCDLSDRLAAVAPVAGGYSTLPPCLPARPVSVLEIHGGADPVVPYTGRGPAHEGGVREFIENWVARDRCPRKPVRDVPAMRVRRADWSPCERRTGVAHIKMLDGGHAWPGGAALIEQRNGRAVLSATQQVWRFFAAH
jgi:polyhydroxybutyrate depolymerase